MHQGRSLDEIYNETCFHGQEPPAPTKGLLQHSRCCQVIFPGVSNRTLKLKLAVQALWGIATWEDEHTLQHHAFWSLYSRDWNLSAHDSTTGSKTIIVDLQANRSYRQKALPVALFGFPCVYIYTYISMCIYRSRCLCICKCIYVCMYVTVFYECI